MLLLIKTLLLKAINDIDAGNSNLTYLQELEILHIMLNINNPDGNRISKLLACDYLGVSRATFDNYVNLGFIPKGEKSQGFKELSWHKYDLDKFLETRK